MPSSQAISAPVMPDVPDTDAPDDPDFISLDDPDDGFFSNWRKKMKMLFTGGERTTVGKTASGERTTDDPDGKRTATDVTNMVTKASTGEKTSMVLGKKTITKKRTAVDGK